MDSKQAERPTNLPQSEPSSRAAEAARAVMAEASHGSAPGSTSGRDGAFMRLMAEEQALAEQRVRMIGAFGVGATAERAGHRRGGSELGRLAERNRVRIAEMKRAVERGGSRLAELGRVAELAARRLAELAKLPAGGKAAEALRKVNTAELARAVASGRGQAAELAELAERGQRSVAELGRQIEKPVIAALAELAERGHRHAIELAELAERSRKRTAELAELAERTKPKP